MDDRAPDDRLSRRGGWALAAHPATGALFVAVAAAAFLPGSRLWGFNHLAFYSVPLRLAGLAFIGLFFVPRVGELFFDGFHRAQRVLSGRRGIATAAAISVLSLVAFVAFASKTELLGDGLYVANNIERSARVDREVFEKVLRDPDPIYPATEMINLGLSRVLARAFGFPPLSVVRILNAFFGALLVFAILAGCRRAASPRGESSAGVREALVTVGLFSGAMQIFFGYIEAYAPVMFFTGLYALTARRTLLRGAGLAWPITLAMAALLMHLVALILLPSLALVIVWVALRREWSDRFKRAALVLFGVTVGAPFIVADVAGLNELLLPVFPTESSPGVLSPSHLVDVANELMLLFPGIAVLGAIAAIAVADRLRSARAGDPPPTGVGDQRSESGESFISVLLGAFLSVPSLLFLVFFKPELGMARDWDLFAITAAGPIVFVLAALGEAGSGWAGGAIRGALPPVFSMTVVLFAAWIGINADPGRSAARFDGILSYDRSRAGYAYESLASLHKDRGDTAAEIRALEKAVDASANPRYLYTLGLRYYHVGERERALATLDRCLRMRPGHAMARQSLIQMLYFMKRYDELVRVAEEGARIDPTQGAYPFFMGKAYVETRNIPEALKAFERCRELNPPPEVASEIESIIRSLGPSEPGAR